MPSSQSALQPPLIIQWDLQAGTLVGTACANCTVEVFSDNRDEGAIYEGRVEVGGVLLDPGTRQVIASGAPVELTTFEFDILELLMRNAGHVLSRDTLMENFYNRKATPFDRSIDMHISHLRKKLENGDALIKTIRGVGYQFSRGPQDAAPE